MHNVHYMNLAHGYLTPRLLKDYVLRGAQTLAPGIRLSRTVCKGDGLPRKSLHRARRYSARARADAGSPRPSVL